MVKVEHSSSNSASSDSDNEIPSTPLAASTQIATYGRFRGDLTQHSSESEHSEGTNRVPATNNVSKSSDSSVQKYLTKFPNVRLSKPRYSVDVDLTDPDDEFYLVTCPASIDAKKYLLNAQLGIPSPGKVSRIESTATGPQLEACVSEKSTNNPVTILAGKQLKSFVPSGIIQIRETMEKAKTPRLVKQEATIDEVPFPDVIRERHPLLGLHYKPAQKLPKHVKKALALAQQRSTMWYLQKGKTIKIDDSEENGGKGLKRKRVDSAQLQKNDSGSEDADQILIKRERPSPSKKAKKEKLPESAVEDDLSWLQNI